MPEEKSPVLSSQPEQGVSQVEDDRIPVYDLDDVGLEPTYDLSPAVQAKIDESLAPVFTLWKDYADINRRAEEGEAIHGQDFLQVEAEFNSRIDVEGLDDKLQAIKLWDAIKHPLVDKIYRTVSGKEKRDLMPQVSAYIQDAFFMEMRKHPEMGRVFNSETIDRAFVQQRLIEGVPRENTNVPESVQTEQELVQTLLANNVGFAVGEVHTQSEADQFLVRNMTEFRANGVDTIYIEGNDKRIQRLLAASDEDLGEYLAYAETPEGRKRNREFVSRVYHVPAEEVDDVDIDNLRMFKAAREQGIRIVNIDKTGAARPMELAVVSHRLASTNFIWTDNIQQDRERSGLQGKYIVFGGAAHFDSDGLAFEAIEEGEEPMVFMRNNGLVDEALGIPSISFQKQEDGTNKVFIRGTNPNGPDFYLPASEDHPDMVEALLPGWVSALAELQKPGKKFISPEDIKYTPVAPEAEPIKSGPNSLPVREIPPNGRG